MINAELIRFLSDVQIDSALKARLTAMGGRTKEQRAAALRALGYRVDVEDLEAKSGLLDDADLKDVAGGGGQLGRTLHNLWNEIWN